MTKRYQSLFLIWKFKNSNRVRENVCDELLGRGFFYLQNFSICDFVESMKIPMKIKGHKKIILKKLVLSNDCAGKFHGE